MLKLSSVNKKSKGFFCDESLEGDFLTFQVDLSLNSNLEFQRTFNRCFKQDFMFYSK